MCAIMSGDYIRCVYILYSEYVYMFAISVVTNVFMKIE